MYPTTGNTQNVEARDDVPQKQQTRVDITRATQLTEEVENTVNDLFEYHEWDDDQRQAGVLVRLALAHAVKTIIRNVPPCPTRTRAMNKIVESRMDCNAAITHHGRY